MKRKIEDYKKQKIAIYCSSKEEWDKIDNLFGKKGLTRDYGDINNPDNMFVDCIHINRMGTASKECYEQKGYIVYPASDFLETEIIPEYVEYIDTKYKGQIVKVEEWTSHSFCCIRFENGQREQPFKHLVKSSTKDAYEAQNKPKQLTVDDLIKDEIYVFDINKNKDFISKFDCIESDNYYDCCFIHKNEFENDPDSLTISEIRNIRLATIEEKKWLNTCITQDKFIPKEDLHLYDESGLLIKKEEAMFKKNDYIVVLYNDNSLNSWTNQCFKQLEDLYYLKVVKNLNGNTDGWSVINFKNQSKWRYASSAEILEYERIGKPFDVTTLIKKEKSLVKQVQEGLKLKDRWVKCVKECGWNTINVGEYIQILENNSLVPYVEWKDNKENYCIDLDRIDKAEFELMPEGFSLNEKIEYKVGDWVFGTILGSFNYNKCKHPVKIIEIKEDRFRYDLLSNPKTDYPDNKSCFYFLNTIVRKASEKEIAMHLGNIIHNQYPLTPIESFQASIYDLKDIYIAPIIKKETKIQTTIIESSVDLNLNLTKIKSKQIQTIKI